MVKDGMLFPWVGKRQESHFIPILFNFTLEALLNAIREEKEMKGMHIEKQQRKLFLIAHEMRVCVGIPMNVHNNYYNQWMNIAKSIYKSQFLIYIPSMNNWKLNLNEQYIYNSTKNETYLNLSKYE